MNLKALCISDLGRSRDINEDSCAYIKLKDDVYLLIVADGMGGHSAGEVASKMAVNSITDFFRNNLNNDKKLDDIKKLVQESILKANRDIYQNSILNSKYSGMGTTVTLALIYKGTMIVGHVGDSRAYLYKKGRLEKVTTDHSLVAELVKNGTITEAEALHHPQKNIITRALGVDEDIKIDIVVQEIEEGNRILLCTDGLSNMVYDDEIEERLKSYKDIEEAAHDMVDTANNRGGFDNITVIIAEVVKLSEEVER